MLYLVLHIKRGNNAIKRILEMIYTYQMERVMLITTVSQAGSETEYDHQAGEIR